MLKPFKITLMNTIRRFLFKDLDIRGQHLSIDTAWQAMIQDRGYSKQVRQMFGASACPQAGMKNSDR